MPTCVYLDVKLFINNDIYQLFSILEHDKVSSSKGTAILHCVNLAKIHLSSSCSFASFSFSTDDVISDQYLT